MNLFEQNFTDFHNRENTIANEEIFIAQEKRLNRNANVIFECLMEGRRLSGKDCIKGITTLSGKYTEMSEYRKRFDEIGNYLNSIGFNLSEEVGERGCKSWWIEKDVIELIQWKLLNKAA